MGVKILLSVNRFWRRGLRAMGLDQAVEGGGELVEKARAQGKVDEFALAVHIDESGCLQFLYVMGEGGGSYGERRQSLRTAERALRTGYPFQ